MTRGFMRCVAAAALTMAALEGAQADPDGVWTPVDVIGITLEVPLDLVAIDMAPAIYDDGLEGESAHFTVLVPDAAFVVRNLARLSETERPYTIVSLPYEDATDTEITYEVDKAELGVVSGYRGDNIFYEICKARSGRFHCFVLEYPEADRALVDDHIARMVRTL